MFLKKAFRRVSQIFCDHVSCFVANALSLVVLFGILIDVYYSTQNSEPLLIHYTTTTTLLKIDSLVTLTTQRIFSNKLLYYFIVFLLPLTILLKISLYILNNSFIKYEKKFKFKSKCSVNAIYAFWFWAYLILNFKLNVYIIIQSTLLNYENVCGILFTSSNVYTV